MEDEDRPIARRSLPADDPLSTLLEKLEVWLSQGRLADARVLETRLRTRAGHDPRFWTGLGDIHTRLGQWTAALAARRHAATLAPHDVEARLALAEGFAAAGYWADAAREVDAVLTPGTPSGSRRIKAAQVLLQVGQARRAAALVRESMASQPGAPGLFALAACERQIGDITQAAEHIEAVLQLEPENADALWLRSDLVRATPARNHVDDLSKRRSTSAKPGLDTRVLYALGKELEDLGQWDAAFVNFAEGAALERARNRYDLAHDLRVLEEVRLIHGRRHSSDGDPSPAPIFVVGLPRTGTSLIQAILASHPQVSAGGELPAFDRALYDLAMSRGACDEFAVRRMGPGLPAADLGRRYLEQVGELASRPRFIDKRPLNILNVALIRAALPNARIIVVQRDLRDAAWAMFKTLFNTGAYGFSYDLDEIGRYLTAYDGLASHWRARFDENLLHVRYEDVVADVEGEARRMLTYCGLPWEPRCARPHLSSEAAASASAVQVRRPVYASSVGLWRRYENHLAPLIKHLGPG